MAEKFDFLQTKEVKDFNQELEKYDLGPLWEAIPELMHHRPKPQAEAYLWKGEVLQKKLMEAANIFTPERGGERRAIYLQNPGLKYRQPWGWASTTQTLYAAVQLLLPGEKAPSHRHWQNAQRFVTHGEGAYTIVQGQRIFMKEGSFLITPGGLWHGHEHVGDKPMIWMDILDIPMVYSIGGTFFDHYPDLLEQPSLPDDFGSQRYEGGVVRPISDRHSHIAPVGCYRWEGTLAAIEGLSRFEPDPYDGYAVEYYNPSNGETANPTMATWMQKLPKGFHTKAHRHTHAVIYNVFKGSGYSVIDGVKFEWTEGDYFVIPNWALHEHVAYEDTFLFSTSDLPIMEKFNLERSEALDTGNGRQEIKSEFKPKTL
ncbi:cupin domain-containing protein [Calidifontibacillus erzurumensis]|uniref:Cupin domain-containing protein n=1 Tax=Calidifontibacillus erzurumensis TaxID=2741433 RepID=A0A8J8GCY4_9BACI|nr:cupin domain-containing protein [Calidifontibacillus erzurumensis]NSL51392.1 cupin domain-containing protein [Calidifontibacillus erzurumensis]